MPEWNKKELYFFFIFHTYFADIDVFHNSKISKLKQPESDTYFIIAS